MKKYIIFVFLCSSLYASDALLSPAIDALSLTSFPAPEVTTLTNSLLAARTKDYVNFRNAGNVNSTLDDFQDMNTLQQNIIRLSSLCHANHDFLKAVFPAIVHLYQQLGYANIGTHFFKPIEEERYKEAIKNNQKAFKDIVTTIFTIQNTRYEKMIKDPIDQNPDKILPAVLDRVSYLQEIQQQTRAALQSYENMPEEGKEVAENVLLCLAPEFLLVKTTDIKLSDLTPFQYAEKFAPIKSSLTSFLTNVFKSYALRQELGKKKFAHCKKEIDQLNNCYNTIEKETKGIKSTLNPDDRHHFAMIACSLLPSLYPHFKS